MATPYSQIPDISASQSQKEVTANQAHALLEKLAAELLSLAITSADITLTDAQHNETLVIRASGAFTANRNVIVKNRKHLFLVEHNGTGGFTLTVKTSAGSGVAVSEGNKAIVYCDGTNVVGPF